MDVMTARWSPSLGWSDRPPEWDSERTLVVAFCAANLIDDPGPLKDLAGQFPRSVVVGCSTAGEIFGETLDDDGVAVAIARFEQVRLTIATEDVSDSRYSYEAGSRLGKELAEADPDLASILLLSDGTGVNGSALAAGLTDGAPDGVAVAGGLAADGSRFARTWVLAEGAPRPGAVSAVGLSGRGLRVGYGSAGGWAIFGPQRRVTRSVGNVVQELDGQPALELYKRYLGEKADQLPGAALLYPLSVRPPGCSDRSVVRTILGIDEDALSMTFAGDVPEGSMAQLMRANIDELIDGAAQAGAAAALTGVGPVLAIAVSCVGRRLLMARRTEDELEALGGALGPEATVVGFYSYGEIAPLPAGTCDLQNQTMTVMTLAEVA